jgi:hypothetical protein
MFVVDENHQCIQYFLLHSDDMLFLCEKWLILVHACVQACESRSLDPDSPRNGGKVRHWEDLVGRWSQDEKRVDLASKDTWRESLLILVLLHHVDLLSVELLTERGRVV